MQWINLWWSDDQLVFFDFVNPLDEGVYTFGIYYCGFLVFVCGMWWGEMWGCVGKYLW